MIREPILFRPFFSLLLLLSFSPFCTYEPTSQIHPKETDHAVKSLSAFDELIDFVVENKIPTFLMLPNIRSYGMKELKVDAAKLKRFVNQKFKEQTPKDIHFYNSIHDNLIELFEEEL